ncbi:MAG: enoyl-CoA hydratase/isomerase family protein [Ruminococcus sp.]|nr:enoyl-CoA hydratase/isomerase family protein [Ruminococcus sp.]
MQTPPLLLAASHVGSRHSRREIRLHVSIHYNGGAGFKLFQIEHFFTFLSELPFPTVSAVTGFCIGSGSEIAVNSTYRVIEKNARIGQPESTFGILPALGGLARTISICGLQNAYELVMSGELIPAEKAFELGWADIYTDKKQGLTEAIALIEYIASKGKFAPSLRDEYLSGYLSNKGGKVQ